MHKQKRRANAQATHLKNGKRQPSVVTLQIFNFRFHILKTVVTSDLIKFIKTGINRPCPTEVTMMQTLGDFT